MQLLPPTVILAALVACTASLLIGALAGAGRWRSLSIEPRARVWVLMALLCAPFAAGLSGLVLAFEPCLRTLALGLKDDCHSHGGVAADLCLQHPPSPTWLAWILAGLFAVPMLLRLARLARGIGLSRRLLARLHAVGSPDPGRQFLIVPGSTSFVAGWPRGEVCVGDELRRCLSPDGVLAVVAHERAHLRRGDIHLRLLARLLAGMHLPWSARLLLEQLDLAIEQACDAEAARAVGDPLVVAQTLVDVAQIRAANPAGALAAFVTGSLECRVRALCSPAWRRPRVMPALLACLLVMAAGLVFARQIHELAEALVQPFAR